MGKMIVMMVGFGGIILLLLTVGFVIVALIKAFRTGGISKKDRMANAEETRMIQDIYHSLSKMEERIETLETILIDRTKKDFDDEKTA